MPNIRVCKERYPKGSYKRQRDDGFPMDDILKDQIDVLIKNVVKDWDFTIIITGGGEVRVGKSVLAMQIGAYWTEQMEKIHGKKVPFSVNENFVLDGRRLIERGNALGINNPYSCLIFDEAGADLEGRKVMRALTQDVLDYYRECGQYNLLNILVLPDYFDLPKGIALSRSICLIDVYYYIDEEGNFTRGNFNFYSRKAKKYLYMKGKRDLNYRAHPHNFMGSFVNFHTVDEQEYRKIKQEALIKRESMRRNKFQTQRDGCWYLLSKEFGMTQQDIAKRMEQLTGIFVAQAVISDGIRHYLSEQEVLSTQRT